MNCFVCCSVSRNYDDGDTCLRYCIARGLCSRRNPFMKPNGSKNELKYSMPQGTLNINKEVWNMKKEVPSKTYESQDQFSTITIVPDFVSRTRHLCNDFAATDNVTLPSSAATDNVTLPSSAATDNVTPSVELFIEHREKLLWLPKIPNANRVGNPEVYSEGCRGLGRAVVLEHLIDYYRAIFTTTDNDLCNKLCCTVKLLQLQPLSGLFNVHTDDLYETIVNDGHHYYQTRPVARDKNHNTLYPYDPGIAQFLIYHVRRL